MLAQSSALRDVMEAIAGVTNLTLRAGQPGRSYDYQFYQSDDQRDREERQVAASERREQQALEAQQAALLRAMDRAMAAKPPDRPLLADLLASLTPEQRSALAAQAAEPVGAITVGNNSYAHDHLLFADTFRNLIPALQDSVRSMLGQQQPPGGGSYNAGVQNAAELNGSSIGLVGLGGGVYLGVVPANGKDVYFTPANMVHRPGLPGVDSDNDLHPEVNEALHKGRLVDLDDMPKSLRYGRRLRFPNSINRTMLVEVLESIATQSGLSIIADGYVRSRRTTYWWLLTDRDEYTLDAALNQVALAFGHRFRYSQGVLRVETVTPGLDLRAEFPARLIERLEARTKKNEPLDLADCLELADMPPVQWETLMVNRVPGIRAADLWTVRKLRAVLRFYSVLSKDQRTKAESDAGLLLADMHVRQRQMFTAIAESGLPGQPRPDQIPARAGFYVRREEIRGGAEQVLFYFAPHETARVKRYQLSIGTSTQSTP